MTENNDAVQQLIERFKRRNLSAEELVRELALIRRAELTGRSGTTPQRAARYARVGHGAMGNQARTIDLRDLTASGAPGAAEVPESVQQAREALRQLERFR